MVVASKTPSSVKRDHAAITCAAHLFHWGETKRREEEDEAEWSSRVGDRNAQSERKKQRVGGNKGKKQVWEKKKTSLLTFCTNINKQLHKREREKWRKVCIKTKRKRETKEMTEKAGQTNYSNSRVKLVQFPVLVQTWLWYYYFKRNRCPLIILAHCVCIHLISLGLQSIVGRPSLLELLIQLIHLLLLLFLQTLPLLLKFCYILHPHTHSDLEQVQETELDVFFSFSKCRSDPLMLFLQLPCPLLVLQPTAFCVLSLALELLLKLFQSMLSFWCLSLTIFKKRF